MVEQGRQFCLAEVPRGTAGQKVGLGCTATSVQKRTSLKIINQRTNDTHFAFYCRHDLTNNELFTLSTLDISHGFYFRTLFERFTKS